MRTRVFGVRLPGVAEQNELVRENIQRVGETINEKNLTWSADEEMDAVERVTNPGGRRSKKKDSSQIASGSSSVATSSSSSSVSSSSSKDLISKKSNSRGGGGGGGGGNEALGTLRVRLERREARKRKETKSGEFSRGSERESNRQRG